MFKTSVSGRLTRDAELRYTPSGRPVANLSVAHNTRVRDDEGQWTDGDTAFFDLTIWGRLAEAAADLKRGEAILAELNGAAPRARAWIGKSGEAAAGIAYTASAIARTVLPPRRTDDDSV